MSICNKNKLYHHKTISVVLRSDEAFTFCSTHWIPLMKNPVQFVCLKVSKYQQIYLNFTWLMNWTAMIMFAKTKIKKEYTIKFVHSNQCHISSPTYWSMVDIIRAWMASTGIQWHIVVAPECIKCIKWWRSFTWSMNINNPWFWMTRYRNSDISLNT